MRNMNTIAAIDIGSNAVRFIICAVEGSDKKCRKVAFLRVPIRLGEDAFISGVISQERGARLCEAMQSFRHLMKAFGVRACRACATSAMRDAENGAAVIAEIKEKSGIDVEVISGEQEAEIIYAAAQPFLASSGGGEKNTLHVDVGGGSTETVVYAEGRVAESHSFPLGTVRLLNKTVSGEEKSDFKAALRKIGGKYPIQRIIASGGNINKAQKLLNKHEGEPVSYIELKMLYDMLKKMTFEERIKNFKLNSYRADVIIPALKIFLTVSKLCGAPDLIVPQVGLVDGIIAKLCEERCCRK